ncbi:TetR/AcrR family transcriptional regulator [Cysteiniphilum halobium]|uniref:TetR/AcrR family transcriptional regulator n=1 Tax=Cysteiniphilum halobium TaxID=2219059 RepID=UPI003F84B5DF
MKTKALRSTRPTADKTRQKILSAAKSIFLEKGFDAAYIKDIAELAKVNTNLVFHHFTNKETLWRKVKLSVLEQDFTTPDYDFSSAKAFFKSILDYRFELYSKHPDLVKFAQWQQLTKNESALIGTGANSPQHWLPAIRAFQNSGEIVAHIEAKQIMLFIIFSTHAPFLQRVIPLSSEEKKAYNDMIYNMCCKHFLI